LLVSSLASLLTKEKIVSEVILLDDASDPEYVSFNQKLAEGDFIFHYRNSTNAGRIKTRKTLAETARYNYLLFLDCDVKIIRPDFISKYYGCVKENINVCCGGIVYDEDEPADVKFKLHWKYGRERESKRLRDEQGFLSGNFFISKNLFLNFNTGMELPQYGHEDTLWGIELFKKGIPVTVIDNPVLHEGLEENSVYIKKSLAAVENLLLLEKVVDKDILARSVKLYDWYTRLKKYRVTGLIEKSEQIFRSAILKNLLSYNPSLRYFDWMRLAYLVRLKKKQ
jgi:glycosyltransferase involved in cell wall biosynthesis